LKRFNFNYSYCPPWTITLFYAFLKSLFLTLKCILSVPFYPHFLYLFSDNTVQLLATLPITATRGGQLKLKLAYYTP
jgi:hypothetical protein